MGADWIDPVAGWLATYAIHGTVVLGGVWAITKVLRPPERLEEVLWRFAMIAGFLTAALQTAAGGGVLSVPLGAGSAARSPLPTGARAAVGSTDLAIPDHSGVAPSGGSEAAILPAVDPGFGFADLVVALGIAAAVIGLARFGLRRRALRGLLADRRVLLPGSPLCEALDRLVCRARFSRPVRLSVSAELEAPVAFGVLRPEICVPRRALRGLRPAAQEAMLAHELAHLVRRDPLWLELAHTLRAVFPWQPFLSAAARRLRAIAEFRCDALGARWVAAVDVADCLVEVAGWLVRGRGPLAVEGLVGMTVMREGLEARVDRLLRPSAGQDRDLPALAVAGGLAGATLMLATALPGVGAPTEPGPAARGATDARTVSPPPVPQPDVDTSPEADAWASLLGAVDAERAALAAEIDLLRDEVDRRGPDPELRELVDALDLRVDALDARRAALAVAIREFLDASASAEPLLSESR